MKLRCTIGTQKLRDGRTYSRDDEYELEDEATAQVLIKSGYAVEIKEPTKTAKPIRTIKHKKTGGK